MGNMEQSIKKKLLLQFLFAVKSIHLYEFVHLYIYMYTNVCMHTCVYAYVYT